MAGTSQAALASRACRPGRPAPARHQKVSPAQRKEPACCRGSSSGNSSWRWRQSTRKVAKPGAGRPATADPAAGTAAALRARDQSGSGAALFSHLELALPAQGQGVDRGSPRPDSQHPEFRRDVPPAAPFERAGKLGRASATPKLLHPGGAEFGADSHCPAATGTS